MPRFATMPKPKKSSLPSMGSSFSAARLSSTKHVRSVKVAAEVAGAAGTAAVVVDAVAMAEAADVVGAVEAAAVATIAIGNRFLSSPDFYD